jgi:hypothetical protein
MKQQHDQSNYNPDTQTDMCPQMHICVSPSRHTGDTFFPPAKYLHSTTGSNQNLPNQTTSSKELKPALLRRFHLNSLKSFKPN